MQPMASFQHSASLMVAVYDTWPTQPHASHDSWPIKVNKICIFSKI